MEKGAARTMKILKPPLAGCLRTLFQDASDLVMVSPWLKIQALKWIIDTPRRQPACKLRVLMGGNLRDFLSKASDIEAVEWLLERGAEVRLASNLHAKIYMADRSRAIVTSANLTQPGLGLDHGNVEVGILVEEPEAILELDQLVTSWFAKSPSVGFNWLRDIKAQIKTMAAEKKTLSAAQKVEERLKKLDEQSGNSRVQIPKPERGPVHDDVDVETILHAMFSSRAECEAGLALFTQALAQLPSMQDLRHIISITFRPDVHKLTLNMGMWEIVSLYRKQRQTEATFCVNFQRLRDTRRLTGLIRTSRLQKRWAGDGDYGFVRLKWEHPFEQPSILFESWRMAILHAAEVFRSWKGTSFMRYHRENLLQLFMDAELRAHMLHRAFPALKKIAQQEREQSWFR